MVPRASDLTRGDRGRRRETLFSEVTDATRGDFDGDPGLIDGRNPGGRFRSVISSIRQQRIKTNRATGLFGTCRPSGLGSRRSNEPSENRIGSGEMIGATHDYPPPAQGLGYSRGRPRGVPAPRGRPPARVSAVSPRFRGARRASGTSGEARTDGARARTRRRGAARAVATLLTRTRFLERVPWETSR